MVHLVEANLVHLEEANLVHLEEATLVHLKVSCSAQSLGLGLILSEESNFVYFEDPVEEWRFQFLLCLFLLDLEQVLVYLALALVC